MGLDIEAYSKLARVLYPKFDESGDLLDWENQVEIPAGLLEWTERHWPGRAAGVAPGVYTFGARKRFRAGSYSGYGAWRHMLAQLVGFADANDVWADPKPGPFVELIDFPDNEGVIGPVVAAKLAVDLRENEAAAVLFAEAMPGHVGRERFLLGVLSVTAVPLTGAQIRVATGLWTSSLYITLDGLEDAGDVASEFEPGPYPRARIYWATPVGLERFLDTFPRFRGRARR